MHPKNHVRGSKVSRTDTTDPCEHEPGERFTVYCVTCESEEVGEIEDWHEGVLWRCEECGGAMDLSVVD